MEPPRVCVGDSAPYRLHGFSLLSLGPPLAQQVIQTEFTNGRRQQMSRKVVKAVEVALIYDHGTLASKYSAHLVYNRRLIGSTFVGFQMAKWPKNFAEARDQVFRVFAKSIVSFTSWRNDLQRI